MTQFSSTSVVAEPRWNFPIINTLGYIWANLNPAISFAEGFKAEPASIEIGYGEIVTIEVGNSDPETDEFAPAHEKFFLADRFLSFEAEFPNGNPGGMWFVSFDSPTIKETDGEYLKTNARISLNSPPDSKTPIQSGIIRIKITDVWVAGNFWWPEGRTNFSRISWFLGAIIVGYGKFSGQVIEEIHYVDVLVKVEPYHNVDIETFAPKKLQPNEIISIPVRVVNLGNYNDTFNFRIKGKNDKITLTEANSITLNPGEAGFVQLGVAASPLVWDTGTLHQIIIEAYSIDEPNATIAQQRVFVETQGVYISEISGIIVLLFFAILFLGGGLSIVLRRKQLEGKYKKPDKPWTIPEERQHLEKLKRKDTKKYEQERFMMEDEYKSAMLWYKNYIVAMKQEKKQTKQKPKKPKKNNKKVVKEFFNKSKEQQEPEKPPEPQPKEVPQEPPQELPKQEEQRPPKKDTRDKKKALLKIKKQQEKQKKRFGK